MCIKPSVCPTSCAASCRSRASAISCALAAPVCPFRKAREGPLQSEILPPRSEPSVTCPLMISPVADQIPPPHTTNPSSRDAPTGSRCIADPWNRRLPASARRGTRLVTRRLKRLVPPPRALHAPTESVPAPRDPGSTRWAAPARSPPPSDPFLQPVPRDEALHIGSLIGVA